MNRIVCRFILVFLWVTWSYIQSAQASHSMGADLTYSCLGNNQFEVRLTFYRDCLGITPDPFARINVNSSCYPDAYFLMYLEPGTGQEITPVCSSEVTTCQGGTYTGIQEYVYSAVITLPVACNDWVFSYDVCCRNAAITTIVDPDTNNMYIYTMLDNTVTPCNSSPVFSNRPVPFVCLGQEFCFNHGAYDPDGDSLVYSLITPYGIYGSQVSYIPPYSANNPLLTSPAMTFNPATGDFCMTPTQIDVTVMAVQVDEYRNGVLIGSVERDIQITVIPCTNVVPDLSGINGTNNFSLTTCADQQLCFTVNSSDGDAVQNTYISWDYSIPGATFTISPSNRETGTFCWTPSQADISNVPHCFTLTVTDDNCPYSASQTFSYCITVQGPRVTTAAGALGCNIPTTTVTASIVGNGNGATYLWNTGATTSSINVGAGTYIVQVTRSGCTSRDTITVAPGTTSPTAAFTITSTCSGTDVTFTNQSAFPGGSISGYIWTFGDGTTSTSTNPSHTYAAAGNYNVTLIAQTANGCNDTIVQPISLVASLPTASFSSVPVCVGSTTAFQDNSTSAAFWQWNFGDGASSTTANPSHIYATAGTYSVTLSVTNAGGCTDSVTQQVTVNPSPTPDAGPPVSICEGASTTLSGSGGGSYQWTPGGTSTSSLTVSPAQTQTYLLEVTSANGCVASDSVIVTVQPPPVLVVSPVVDVCEGSPVTVSVSTSTAVDYAWTPGGNVDSSFTVTPVASESYTVLATDNLGCTSTAVTSINVFPYPLLAVASTPALCSGSADGSAVASVTSGTGPFTFDWGTGIVPDSTQTTLTAGSYQVIVNDSRQCSDTISFTVTEPSPILISPSTNPVGCNGESTGSASIAVSGGTSGYTYSWSPGGATSTSLNNLPAGNYTVTVVDSNACIATETITVTEPNPLALVFAMTPATCDGLSNGSATATVSGGSPQYVYSWSPTGGNSSSESGLSAGWYSITANDINGCLITDSVLVTQPTPITATTSTQAATCAVANGSASVSASGGTPGNGYQYSWSPGGATGSNVTGLLAGTYNVTVTDQNGCAGIFIATVGNLGAPVVDASVIQPVSCFSGADGMAAVQVISGNGPFSYLWPGGTSNDTLINRAAGTYAVEVTDANGCVAVDTITLTQPPALTISTSVNPVACFGDNTGSVTVSVSGGVNGYSYSWSSGATTSSVNNLTAGNYSVTVIDANGCTATAASVVSQPNALIVALNAVPATCNGLANGSATVAAQGGTVSYHYSWYPGGSTSQNVNGLAAGWHRITIDDAHGCIITDSILITEPAPITATSNTQPATCGVANGSATLSAQGGTPGSGYQYTWSPGGATGSSVSGLMAGTYNVTVTDQNGCAGVFLATVGNSGAPVVNASVIQPVSCFGGSDGMAYVQVASGNGPFNYSWPGGANNDTLLNRAAGTYVVEVTDINGCVALDTITISQPTALVPTSTATPASCHDLLDGTLSGNVTGGTPNYSYVWNPGSYAGINVTSVGAGTYTLTVTDAQGCTSTTTATITQPTPIQLSTTTAPAACYGTATGTASVSATGGSGACTFTWQPGSSIGTNASTLEAGLYTVVATDSNGCSTSAQVTVFEPDPVSLTVTTDSVSCSGASDASLSVTAAGGNGGYQYLWQPGGVTAPQISGVGSGTYSVLVTDVNGCSATITSTVIDPDPLVLTVSSPPILCIGQSTSLIAYVTGGTQPFTYTWNTGVQSDTITVNPMVTTPYTVSVVDANGCMAAPQQLMVEVFPPLALAVSPLPDICGGDSALLSAVVTGGNGGPYQYSWNDQSISGQTALVYPINDSMFVVTASDGCSPDVIDSVSIRVNPLPQVDLTPQQISGCTPVEVLFANQFSVPDGSIYQWDLDDNSTSTDSTPSHTYTTPGTYDVSLMVTTPEGCSTTQLVNDVIQVYGFPTASFDQSATSVSFLTPGVNFFDQSADAITWTWDFGDGITETGLPNPSHIYADSGTYQVQLIVTSEGGCPDTTYGLVRIEPEFTIFIPNAFTPNGDNQNEGFIAIGMNIIEYEMWIIDRWGLEIFHSTGFDHPWDGTYYGNGNPCQADVYEYIIAATDVKGGKHRYLGHVTLVR